MDSKQLPEAGPSNASLDYLRKLGAIPYRNLIQHTEEIYMEDFAFKILTNDPGAIATLVARIMDLGDVKSYSASKLDKEGILFEVTIIKNLKTT